MVDTSSASPRCPRPPAARITNGNASAGSDTIKSRPICRLLKALRSYAQIL